MNYMIYELASGRIARTVDVSPADLALQIDPATQAARAGALDDSRYYIVDGEPIEFPARPDAHHRWDWASRSWLDPRSLSDHKAAKWTEIKRTRDQAEFGSFTWSGSTFDSDAMSQSRIQGAVQLAGLDPAFVIDWTLADNGVRTLNAQDMAAVGLALGQHVAAQHAKARTLRAQIEAATTVEQVEAVAW